MQLTFFCLALAKFSFCDLCRFYLFVLYESRRHDIKITHYCAMSVTCLFQYTGIRIFNDHTCERRIICSTRSVYIFLEKKTPFSPNIIFYYITAPRLNKKYVAPGHQNLAGEFCVVGGEFSDLRCLMNTLCCTGGPCSRLEKKPAINS